MDDEKKKEKKSFVMYADFEDSFNLLNEEYRGKLITAIFQYNKTGVAPTLTGEVQMAFSFIKKTLERDYIKWMIKCKKNAEAGRKGGVASGEARSVQSNDEEFKE